MIRQMMRTAFVAAALMTCGGEILFAQTAPAAAHEFTSPDGTLKIVHPWTRATPAGAKVAGGFLKVTNTGKESDRLIGGSFVPAGKVEVHEMAVTDGVMRMRQLEAGIEIKPGETVELKPGGLHMMFIDLTGPIKEGDKIEGTLVFQRAGTVAVHYKADAMGAPASGHKH